MSLDSVLDYDSMSEVRKWLAQVQGRHALEKAYQAYDGHQRPSQRAAYFRRKWALHDLVRLGGPHSDEDVHAYLVGLCHAAAVSDGSGDARSVGWRELVTGRPGCLAYRFTAGGSQPCRSRAAP